MFLSNRFQSKARKKYRFIFNVNTYANLILKWPWAEYIQEGNWMALLPYHGPLYSFHNKRHILTSKRGSVMSLTSSFHLFGGSNRSKEFHRVLCKRETSKETFKSQIRKDYPQKILLYCQRLFGNSPWKLRI